MAESTMTRAAPGDGEAAGALLATKELVKPEEPRSIKGILAGAAAASFALGLLAAVTPSTRQAPVGLAGDRWSLTVEGGLGSVDPNYVSFVVDPASLEVVKKYPSYPYPVDFTSPALKALVKELAPALFVITGGNSNCISYADGFDPGSSPKSSADNYLSTYCEGKTYYGNLEPALFKTLLDFAADTGTDLVWHLNMAFGRGHSSAAYEPWDAGIRARLGRDRDGLLVFFFCIKLFRVAAAVYFLTDLLVAAAPVVHLASPIAVPQLASTTFRRVVGQWGGAGGACCEDHFGLAGGL